MSATDAFRRSFQCRLLSYLVLFSLRHRIPGMYSRRLRNSCIESKESYCENRLSPKTHGDSITYINCSCLVLLTIFVHTSTTLLHGGSCFAAVIKRYKSSFFRQTASTKNWLVVGKFLGTCLQTATSFFEKANIIFASIFVSGNQPIHIFVILIADFIPSCSKGNANKGTRERFRVSDGRPRKDPKKPQNALYITNTYSLREWGEDWRRSS